MVGVAKGKGGGRKGPAAPSAAGGVGRLPEKNVHRLTNLAQMKALADPRRIRILELLDRERTTKQVAGILGEPPTRLYHHVAALERVGLIRLARTRPSRGALEKYYVAVAKAFSADPRLFTSRRAPQAREATSNVAVQLLDRTADDMRAVLEEEGEGEGPERLQQEGILSYLEIRGSARELKALRTKLAKLIEACTADSGDIHSTARPYRLTIAYFPLARRTRATD